MNVQQTITAMQIISSFLWDSKTPSIGFSIPGFPDQVDHIWHRFFNDLPGSTLHGYLSKILARSCQDLGKFLAKIVTRYCEELQDAMVRSYQESHVSKKNLTKKPNMARKI